MTHSLDRPAWNALTGRQAHLAIARGAAVRIDPGYGLFAAARDTNEDAQAALAAVLTGAEDRVGLVETTAWPAPPGTRVADSGTLVQMVFDGAIADGPDDPRIVLLTPDDAAEMGALARATEPGPWGDHTHRFGAFYGVCMDGRLAAMAGERLLLPGYAEVSGVCTWPEHRGQRLATLLIRHVIRGFVARGDCPFLHCYSTNVAAIRLYEAMGFRRRADLTLTILALV